MMRKGTEHPILSRVIAGIVMGSLTLALFGRWQ